MKSFKKALAAALALAMVVTAVPVTPAEAASTAKLSAKSVTVAAGTAKKQSKTIKVKTPSTWKKVKVVASSSNKKAATVKVSGKTVKVTAVKKGTAKVTVKVTAKKGKKAVKKTLYATAKVVNDGLKFTTAPTDMVIGEEVKLATKVCPSVANVTYASSDDTVATVDATGTVTAVKAGKVTITATSDYGKTATTEINVKTAVLKSATQKKATQIEAGFDGDISKVAKGDITITNTSSNAVFPIKDISADTAKKTITINTYSDMNDAKEYSVKYDGTEVKFTATDGTVADVGISHATITKGTSGTEVKAQFLDKNNVVTKEFTLGEAANDGSVDFSFTENKGYIDGNKLVLLNSGDTATAKVTYHTFKYDSTTGAETGKIEKTFTVTAVDDDATLSDFNYTINLKNTQVNWNTTVTPENKLAVKDTAYAFFYFKDSAGADVTKNYSVESSDKSVLLLDKADLSSYPAPTDMKGSSAVTVTGVKAGSAYINVLNGDGKIVKSLPVVVQETRKLTNLTFNSLIVNKNAAFTTTDSAVIKAYDQYQRETTISTIENEVLSAPSAENTHKKGTTVFPVTYASGKITVNAASLAEGDYQVKITAATADTNCDTNVKVSRVLSVKVVNATANDTSSYQLSVSESKVDLAIASDKNSREFASKNVEAVVNVYKKGAKVDTVTNASITIKNPDGTIVNTDTGSAAATLYKTISADAINSTPLTASSAYTLENNIKTGTYTVSATATISGVVHKFSTTFTLENTQTKAVAKIDKNAAFSQIASGDAKADAKALLAELNTNNEAFVYTYDGVKQTVDIVDVDAKENGKALYITSIDVVVKTAANEYIVVKADINTAFTLK